LRPVEEQPAADVSRHVEIGDPQAPEELYLDLLKKCLTRAIFDDPYQTIDPELGTWKRALHLAHLPLRRLLAIGGMELVRRVEPDEARRAEGHDHPAQALTMVGLRRLDNIHSCIRDVVRDGVEGDLIETGVWRGGSTIFMRGALQAYGDTERVVWVADSFRGLPEPDVERYPTDGQLAFWNNPHLAVSAQEVRDNFRRFGLLDDRVRFLEGWFKDTLPSAPIEKLSVVRLDGDMYESTIDALRPLYPKLAVGGYIIVDDYYGVPTGCGRAVDDYRAEHGIDEEIVRIDWTGAYWRKLR
jgi:O-methyltransferase